MTTKRREGKERRERRGESEEKSRSSCCAATSGATNSEHQLQGKEQEKEMSKESPQRVTMITLLLVSAAFILMIFNQFQLMNLKASDAGIPLATGVATVAASVTPTGTPNVYGTELDINYNDVNPNDPQKADKTIAKLQKYDETITLKGTDLERYVSIASQISCEYCCGVDSIVVRKEDVERLNQQIEAAIAAGKITKEQAEQYPRHNVGDAACGCAHSFAMRGLAKYLITNHGSEFTDEQILGELAKWKTLFFPTQMTMKAQVMKEQGMTFSYANLGSNRYRGIEKGAASASGNMVGGC